MTAVTSSVSNHLRPDTILFNCDGTLVDSEPIINRLIWEMLIELGIDIGLEDPTQHFLSKAIHKELDAIVEMHGVPLPPNWLSISQARRNVLLKAEVEAVSYIGHTIDMLSRSGLPTVMAPEANRMKVEL